MKPKINLLIGFAMLTFSTAKSEAQQKCQMQVVAIQSRWAKEVSPTNALKEYPRPQMVRPNWTSLNGLWDYGITNKDIPQPSTYDDQILVLYPIESALSGLEKALQPSLNLWYKRSFTRSSAANEKTLLHFGAVSWESTVFVNEKEIGTHRGRYSEFTFDITVALREGENELVVKVYDPVDQGIWSYGKQVLNPQSIYYTPNSGIWQTVWLETVPADYIEGFKMTPDIDKGVLNINVNEAQGLRISIKTSVARVLISSLNGSAGTNLQLPVGKPRFWTPADPFLYDLQISLLKNGKVIDKVKSYFGMRKISIAKDSKGIEHIFLNNKPYYNLSTLDQGFWPDGPYIAPTDEALAFDLQAIKAVGFNTVRKRIKIEPAQWYYHADHLGLLVWQDLVSPNQGLVEGSNAEFEKESADELKQLHNYPCIGTWVLFNEKWRQYDQKRLSDWVKATDPSRLLDDHFGELLYANERVRSSSPDAYVDADIIDVHSYLDPMIGIMPACKVNVCGEFGGIGVFIPDHQWLSGSSWGYIQEKPAGLMAKYKIILQHLQLLQNEGLSGSIYTQPFEVEGEQNGLMTYDREVVKISFAELCKIHAPLNLDMGGIPEVTAKDADLTEHGLLYSAKLQQYIEGNRAPEFMNKLAMMATQAGDKQGVVMAGMAYIATLKASLSEQDINSVTQFTPSTKDAGFTLMNSEADAFKKALGERMYTVAMMNMIYKGEIEPVLNASATSDWMAIEKLMKPNGAPGEEIFLRAKNIALNDRQDWNNYKTAATRYLGKYGKNISEQEKTMFLTTIQAH